MHPSVHRISVYNKKDIKATSMSVYKGVNKEDVVCIYTME